MNNVIYTKVSVFRNVKDYKFVPKLENAKKEEIVNKLAEVLKDFSLIDLTKTSEQIKEYISSMQISTKSNLIFLNQKNNLAVTLFDGEHITITSYTENFSDSIFKNVKEVVDLISNKISLSFSDNYGYLMSDLTKIGSAVKIESAIDLNAIKQLEKTEQVKNNISKLGYSLIETKDKNIFKLSTVCNLGFSESEVISEFEKVLKQLEDLEIESAKMLDVENHDEYLDSALRSLAVLKNSHLMAYDELKIHLSNLRLGVNLGLVDVKLTSLNALQRLVKNVEYLSKSEAIDLSNKVKSILKGE